jgi:hypothetical protein
VCIRKSERKRVVVRKRGKRGERERERERRMGSAMKGERQKE